MSTSILDELWETEQPESRSDILEVLAASLRLREPISISIAVEDWVWCLTVFPGQGLYHAPIDWSAAAPIGLGRARLLECEPARLAPPALPAGARFVPPLCHYWLDGLTWTLALDGPRKTLLAAIDRPCRYRVTPGALRPRQRAGALGSAAMRLQRDAASFKDIASWPGLGTERACRLLNALYLDSRLMLVADAPAPSPIQWGMRKERTAPSDPDRFE